MKFYKLSVAILLFFYVPFSGKAWGVLGHRVIGEIADSYLSSHAKKEIKNILGAETVAMASNWADFIRSDTSYKYLTPWHYADIAGGMSHEQFTNYFAADTAVDAFTKINFLVEQLKNNRPNLSLETKKMYLRLLIHIAGDVHQPLHVGRPEDKGGNDIKVKWFGENANLHKVWDESLINFQQLSYTEYAVAINHTTKEQRDAWQREPLSQWMWNSYSLAEKIYANAVPDQKLSYEYNFKFIAALNERLLEGGVHLAGLLNEIFA